MSEQRTDGKRSGHFDVVIIGGGAAGLAAALQLGRARRSVVVIDAGEPRNAPAAHMHSYLGHDGRPPGAFLSIARQEVTAYGVELVDGVVDTVTKHPDGEGFEVVLAGGGVVSGRRVLLATGLVDVLPDVPGVAEQWGRGVIHCPYCHGWEVRDQSIVVLGTGPRASHLTLLFRQLSANVTLVVHEGDGPSADDRARLAARGVQIEDEPVASLVIHDDTITGVRLTSGRILQAQAVAVMPRMEARWRPLEGLGIRPVAAPLGAGEVLETNADGATHVAGVYAAGNVSDLSNQVLQAAAVGSRIGAVINADLVQEDASVALAQVPQDDAAEWDRRYTSVARRWSGSPNGVLVTEIADVEPGSALDVGCGEGADAIWLALRGWAVTGLDPSQVALDRAGRAAAEAGVAIEWVRAGIDATALGGRRYDLVSVQYPAIRRASGDEAISAILDAVAPGGTLLVVFHHLDAEHRRHCGFEPDDYVQMEDLERRLGPGWTIDVLGTRPRILPPGHQGHDAPDLVLRAHRS